VVNSPLGGKIPKVGYKKTGNGEIKKIYEIKKHTNTKMEKTKEEIDVKYYF
jgi:hypothetical protein